MTTAKPIRLLVADDHPVVRAGLTSMLSCYPELEVVGGVASGAAALSAIASSPVDVLLLDLRMPEMTGLDTLRAVRQLQNPPKVIILTSFDSDEDIYQSVLAGTDGYLLKASSDEEMLTAIRTVTSGQRYLPPYIAARFVACAPRAGLTPLEAELLGMLAGGSTDTEIAACLHIKRKEVWAHFDRILDHLVDEQPPQSGKAGDGSKITIEEVAKKAGVSISTVSRVLHNKGNHSDETRSAVIRVVREYGFELNKTAASLAMRRSSSTARKP